MRYLIIDMSKELNGSNSLSLTNHKGEELILNQEESLAKFKEIWNLGRIYGFEEARGMSDQNEDWEQFKETL